MKSIVVLYQEAMAHIEAKSWFRCAMGQQLPQTSTVGQQIPMKIAKSPRIRHMEMMFHRGKLNRFVLHQESLAIITRS